MRIKNLLQKEKRMVAAIMRVARYELPDVITAKSVSCVVQRVFGLGKVACKFTVVTNKACTMEVDLLAKKQMLRRYTVTIENPVIEI